MVTYKIMQNNFAKSTCAQTKAVLKKGDKIYYVKTSDNPDIRDHRAYSPNSQVADWLKIHGTLIVPEPKQTVPTSAPVMASMLHDRPPMLPKSPVSNRPPRIVTRTPAGTIVFYPAR